MPNPYRQRLTVATALLSAVLAGSTMADLPEHYDLKVTPISGPLGLADVVLTVGNDTADRVTLVGRIGGEERHITLRREQLAPGPAGSSRFTARVMLTPVTAGEPGAIEFSLVVHARVSSEQPSYGPFAVSAAPLPGQATPDWAKGAVWYQIFPERFRNGNAANDPRGPAFHHKPWTSDWHTFDTDELDAARARSTLNPPHLLRTLPDPRQAAMQARRYGGDLEGVVEKLDELSDLGVTAIYFNPVFAADSHHKYDATDFRHIDPSLAGNGGPLPANETADPATWQWTDADRYVLDTLLPEIHRRGIRVVFDGVWNHVGTRFWAFQDVVHRGRESPYADWFRVEFADASSLDDPRLAASDIREGDLIAWRSWNSVNGSLPIFARDVGTGRLHPDVESHIFDVTTRWMRPAPGVRGIDGWRLDVAPDLPRPFWEAWCGHARSVNPDAALLGEFWFDAREYFSDGLEPGSPSVFDGQMNYPVAMPLVRWLADPDYSARQLTAQLERVLDRPPQHELVQMTLLGSHDTARIATMIEARQTEYNGSVASRVQRSRPSDESYDKVVLGVAILACWPGSPMIYYGDEYGMHGGNDPHCRKPFPWPDAGAMDNPADAPVPGLRERFRAWLRLRQDPGIGNVLRYGDVRIIDSGRPDVFAFERALNDTRVLLIANKGDAAFDTKDLLGPRAERRSAGDRSSINIGARDAAVFIIPPR